MDESRSADDGYLILTRRINETIRIGSDIVLRIVSVGRNVRISIEAPSDQRILRSELLERQPEPPETHSQPAEPTPATRQSPPPAAAAEPPAAYHAGRDNPPKRKPVVRYRRRHRLAVDGNRG